MEAVNYEGWRVAVDEGNGRRGWLLLRQSLHDPLLVLNVESDMQGGKQGTPAGRLQVDICNGLHVGSPSRTVQSTAAAGRLQMDDCNGR